MSLRAVPDDPNNVTPLTERGLNIMDLNGSVIEYRAADDWESKPNGNLLLYEGEKIVAEIAAGNWVTVTFKDFPVK